MAAVVPIAIAPQNVTRNIGLNMPAPPVSAPAARRIPSPTGEPADTTHGIRANGDALVRSAGGNEGVTLSACFADVRRRFYELHVNESSQLAFLSTAIAHSGLFRVGIFPPAIRSVIPLFAMAVGVGVFLFGLMAITAPARLRLTSRRVPRTTIGGHAQADCRIQDWSAPTRCRPRDPRSNFP